MSYTESTYQPTQLRFEIFTYQNYKPIQQGPGPQAIFFSVTALLCTREISEDRRCLAIQVVKELGDETAAIALAGQEQTLLRQHDCECAFRR